MAMRGKIVSIRETKIWDQRRQLRKMKLRDGTCGGKWEIKRTQIKNEIEEHGLQW